MWTQSLGEKVSQYLEEYCKDKDGNRTARFMSKVAVVKTDTWTAGYETKLKRLAGILRGDSENTLRYWTDLTQKQLAEEFETQLAATLDDDLNIKF